MAATVHHQQIIAHDPILACEQIPWQLDLAGGYDEGMSSGWQFSMRYLLVELLLLGVAMGLTRAVVFWPEPDLSSNLPYFELTGVFLCMVVAAGCWGAAIGGLFGRMKVGGRIATYAVLLWLALAIVSNL